MAEWTWNGQPSLFSRWSSSILPWLTRYCCCGRKPQRVRPEIEAARENESAYKYLSEPLVDSVESESSDTWGKSVVTLHSIPPLACLRLHPMVVTRILDQGRRQQLSDVNMFNFLREQVSCFLFI